MKKNGKGFTLIELLVVIGIIGLLLSIAVPAFNEARIHAKVVTDKASLSSMSVAIESFVGDMGHYPESGPRPVVAGTWHGATLAIQPPGGVIGSAIGSVPPDQGAHRLFEALVGLDTLGYQRDNYYQVFTDGTPVAPDRLNVLAETERHGPYVDMDSVKIDNMQTAHSEGSNYSNNFPVGGNDNPVFVDGLSRNNPRAILYYRANSNGRAIETIYNYNDNVAITQDTLGGTTDPIHPDFTNVGAFRQYLWDPDTGVDSTGAGNPSLKLASAYARPYNKDTFILINAGRDGKYGTPDDITNFTIK